MVNPQAWAEAGMPAEVLPTIGGVDVGSNCCLAHIVSDYLESSMLRGWLSFQVNSQSMSVWWCCNHAHTMDFPRTIAWHFSSSVSDLPMKPQCSTWEAHAHGPTTFQEPLF